MVQSVRRVLIGFGYCVGVAALLLLLTQRRGFFDLMVYHGAVHHWLNHDGNLYDFLQPKSTYGFTYPPFAAVVMAPMALLGRHATIAVSLALTLAAIALLIRWLVLPMARRYGWTPWLAVVLAAGLVALFEPVGETVAHGQVNLLLLGLVTGDLLLVIGSGRRGRFDAFGGVGIGLATAIKLTPGIFIGYLLLVGRYRAAALAGATAGFATLLAAALAPEASHVYWTDALWDTGRVGAVEIVANQSLHGLVARLGIDAARLCWLGLVALALLVWVYRVRRANAAGDELAGLALTGVVGCLVSPISWVHHLVWVLPAMVVLFDHALRPGQPRWRLAVAIGVHGLLSSRLIWAVPADSGGWGMLAANGYVFALAGLLLWLPVQQKRFAGSRYRRLPSETCRYELSPLPTPRSTRSRTSSRSATPMTPSTSGISVPTRTTFSPTSKTSTTAR